MLGRSWIRYCSLLLLMAAASLSACHTEQQSPPLAQKPPAYQPKEARSPYLLNQARGADELVVYDPHFGETTNTNQYGYEVTVEEGVIVSLGGANSIIPKNGFILSGHGKGATFLTDHSVIGSHVILDESSHELILHTDLTSYQFQAKQAAAYAADNISRATTDFYDFPRDRAQQQLSDAEQKIAWAKAHSVTDPQQAYQYLLSANQAAQRAYYYTIESERVEQRGIWHRPEENNLQEVINTVIQMHDSGFNSIYLEVNFWGYTIYPSNVMANYGMAPQHPRFKDNDYGHYGSDILAAYIGEASKLGMSVQGWTDGFMVGSATTEIPIPPQLTVNPHWLAIQNSNRQNALLPDTKTHYFWLDIAQEEVQAYMLAIYQEMQERYAISGLNIDYMRYPHYAQPQAFSFNPITLSRYQQASDIADVALLRTDDRAFAEYKAWLRAQENLFVKQLAAQTKRLNPHFMLTATPEPGSEEIQIADWQEDIDGVIPQAYGHDFASIHNHVNNSKKLMPANTIYYTGIYSFYHKLGAMGTVQDVLAARYQTSGVNMFAFGQGKALPDARQALRQGPWREPAYNPGEHLLGGVAHSLADITDKFTRIYIPNGAITHKEGDNLTTQLQRLSAQADAGEPLLGQDLDDLVKQITELTDSTLLNSKVGARIHDRLAQIIIWNQRAQLPIH